MVRVGKSNERRAGGRRNISLLVQYRFEAFESFAADYCANLSPGGIFIETQHPKGLGDPIYLQFSDKSRSELLEGLGTVVRVRPPGRRGAAGMGIRFISFDAQSLAQIERICRPEAPAAARRS